MDERHDDPDDLDSLSSFSSSHYSPSEFSPSTSLSPLRSHLRALLLPIVSRESHTIARLQKRYRTPFWDRYFVYTSSLGTHTFFMILLPAMFFFGARDVGMGLVMVMGGGVYASSVVKDLVCSPRPLAPPVTRLTIGTHHLEYGFPSTHSTNSVSIALFFWGYVHTLFSDDPAIYWSCTFLLIIYTLSIVFGRIYTAMHSFVDCVFGVLLGAAVWWCVTDMKLGDRSIGLGFSTRLQTWIVNAVSGSVLTNATSSPTASSSSFASHLTSAISTITYSSISPPILLTTFFLLLVNQHPQPIDDCPCFEDAIASGAVVYGALLGRWANAYFHLHDLVERLGGPRPMIGSGWDIINMHNGTSTTDRLWVPTPLTPSHYLLFTLFALLKLSLGISLIFIWRLFAKSLLGLVLPRYSELSPGSSKTKDRVISLGLGMGTERSTTSGDACLGVEMEGGIGSGFARRDKSGKGREIKSRTGNGNSKLANQVDEDTVYSPDGDEEKLGSGRRKHVHYDADVLTKILVYAGIAILSIEVTPLVFELLGWGVYLRPPEGVGVFVQGVAV
ncbi:hypothetical protein C8R42DRAFT_682616 [Lentinula raphanica]|nr:hypothetical protein C8R42DRAFT_682616 [Lentinula raphanica]